MRFCRTGSIQNSYITSRPETIESLFIAYRLTGDNIYREYGWKIFRSLETYCRLNTGGYATIVNVDEIPVTHEDKMETFMLVRIFPDFGFLSCI